jgi:stage V sporulation protein S
MENLFKVSTTSRAPALAGAIAKSVRDGHQVVLQAIGAGAVNQAMKSIAVARGYLAREGLDLVTAPSFVDLTIEGRECTALRLFVDRSRQTLPAVDAIGQAVAVFRAPAVRSVAFLPERLRAPPGLCRLSPGRAPAARAAAATRLCTGRTARRR